MTVSRTTRRVLDALGEVYDPELDEPITRLGFVTSCEVRTDGDVEVVLRLPTPQCAPNFAFLMAADARKVVRRLPEVSEVTIKLEDHYTGEEINAALGRGEGFTGAFPGETVDDDLATLRELFLQGAGRARVATVRDAAGGRGHGAGGRGASRRGPARRPRRTSLRRAAPPAGPAARSGSPGFVLPSGEPVLAEELMRWLRTARLMRISLEVNGGMCRSLLRVHRGVVIDDPEEVLR